MATVFKPSKPMRYPKADGTTMSQIELYDMLTNTKLDLRSIAKVVEPITKGAQAKLEEGYFIPEIVVMMSTTTSEQRQKDKPCTCGDGEEEHECAIPMCGADEGSLLFPMCENGHWIHAECLQMIAENSSKTNSTVCPMCRSSAINVLNNSISIPIDILSRTPFSILGATMAVYIGKLQHH